MSSIPLPALGIKPPAAAPDPIDQFSKIQGLRDLMARNALTQQQLQEQQQLAPLRVQGAQADVEAAQQKNQLQQIDLQNVKKQQDYWTDPSKFQLPENGPKPPAGSGFAERALGLQSDDPLAQHINGLIRAGVNPSMGPNSALATGKQLLDFRSNVLKQTADQQKVTTDGLAAVNKILTPIAAEPDAGKRAKMLSQASDSLEEASRFDPSIHQAVMTADPNHLDKITTMTGALSDIVQAGLKSGAEESGKITAQQNAAGPGKAFGTGLDVQEANDWLDKNKGKTLADYMKYKATLVPQFNFNLQGGAGGGLNSAALDQAAQRYAQTGELPAMGMGAAGAQARKQIMNRAGELFPNGSIAANSAEYKANTDSLKKIQTNFDQVSAFENTALKNIDLVMQKASKIPELGARFADVPIRMISDKMIGTKAMAEFRTALLTAQTESAKVLSSANANGVLSDSARHEAEDILSGNLPFKSMQGSADTLKQDFANRHQSYADQIADIKGRLGMKAETTQASEKTQNTVPGPGSAKFHYQGKNGEIFSDDGKTWFDGTGKQISAAK